MQKARHLRRLPSFRQLKQNLHCRLDLPHFQQRQSKNNPFRTLARGDKFKAPLRQFARFPGVKADISGGGFLKKALFFLQPRGKLLNFRVAREQRRFLQLRRPIRHAARHQPRQNHIVQSDVFRRKSVNNRLTQIAEQIILLRLGQFARGIGRHIAEFAQNHRLFVNRPHRIAGNAARRRQPAQPFKIRFEFGVQLVLVQLFRHLAIVKQQRRRRRGQFLVSARQFLQNRLLKFYAGLKIVQPFPRAQPAVLKICRHFAVKIA